MRRVLYGALALVAIAVAYVGIVIARGSYVDWQPEGISAVALDSGTAAEDAIVDSVLSLLSWNVGYGGLGAEADFFMDAGRFLVSGERHVHMPDSLVARYMAGIELTLQSTKADFFLLQEVDSFSARSHHELQLARFRKTQPAYAAAFTPNYINERVPIPVLQPWAVYGDVYSGLLTLSRFAPERTERHALPGQFPFPDQLFQLDRCALVQRHALADGRQLVIINVHLSAYDQGGVVRREQLGYLSKLLRAEHAAGHLVVVGGDWNLVPAHMSHEHFARDPAGAVEHHALPADFLPVDWTYAYDPRVPTNRITSDPYVRDSTFVRTLDYFVVSPGIRVRRVKAIEQDFRWSDHQPVWVELELD